MNKLHVYYKPVTTTLWYYDEYHQKLSDEIDSLINAILYEDNTDGDEDLNDMFNFKLNTNMDL